MHLSKTLPSLCQRYGVDSLYAFGSRAGEVAACMRGEGRLQQSRDSDVDLGALPTDGRRWTAQERVQLTLALEDLLDVGRVDLVVLTEAAPSTSSMSYTPPAKPSSRRTETPNRKKGSQGDTPLTRSVDGPCLRSPRRRLVIRLPCQPPPQLGQYRGQDCRMVVGAALRRPFRGGLGVFRWRVTAVSAQPLTH